MTMHLIISGLIVTSLLVTLGCNPLHTKTDASKAVVDLNQAQFKGKLNAASAESLESNWQTFGDLALQNQLIKVLEDNLDVAASAARLEAAEAAFKASNSTYWPSVDINASRSKSESFIFGRTIAQDQWSMSVAASYEIDVFNRLGAMRASAKLERQASAFDLMALKTSLSATYADQWFQRHESMLVLSLYKEQLKTSEQFLNITKHRFQNGLATATDVLQQKQQVAALKTLKPQLEARVDLIAHQLLLLAGLPASSEVVPSKAVLPNPPQLPELGIPAKLLSARPDLLAILSRVKAIDHRVASAMAGRLPNFRISGNVGVGAQSFSELLDQWLFGLTASLVAPIFDGGRRKAEVTQQEAVLKQMLKQYRATYLNAIKEVQDALVLIGQEDGRVVALSEELRTANALLTESKKRYLNGVGQYIVVINALQSVQRKQRETLSARRAQLTHRISLWRALGGATIAADIQHPEDS